MKDDDATDWPRRVRCAADLGPLTSNGAASHLSSQRGWLNGFWNETERPARDRAIESAYMRDMRETRQALQKHHAEQDRQRERESTE